VPGIPALPGRVNPPLELLQARERLWSAVRAIVKIPQLGVSEASAEDFLGTADEAMADPRRWPLIIQFARDAETQVRGFQFQNPHNPTPQEFDHAVSIMENFTYRAMWEIGGQPKFIAGIAAGHAKNKLTKDPNLRTSVPLIYTTIRARLLGLAI
jgi:hypothetical protein